MTTPVYSAVPPGPAGRQPDPVVLRIEKQGRGGKTVTVLSRVQMHPAGKEELLRKLKAACGAGGWRSLVRPTGRIDSAVKTMPTSGPSAVLISTSAEAA